MIVDLNLLVFTGSQVKVLTSAICIAARTTPNGHYILVKQLNFCNTYSLMRAAVWCSIFFHSLKSSPELLVER